MAAIVIHGFEMVDIKQQNTQCLSELLNHSNCFFDFEFGESAIRYSRERILKRQTFKSTGPSFDLFFWPRHRQRFQQPNDSALLIADQ